MVWPSAGPLAIARVARVPPAPPRFSTTTCWPSVLLMRSATSRARASLPPPAGNGTTSVIGRDGKVCARLKGAERLANSRAANTRPMRGMASSPSSTRNAASLHQMLRTGRKLFRRAHDALDNLLHLRAVNRRDLEAGLGGVGAKFRIRHGGAIGGAQRGEAFGWHVGRCRH